MPMPLKKKRRKTLPVILLLVVVIGFGGYIFRHALASVLIDTLLKKEVKNAMNGSYESVATDYGKLNIPKEQKNIVHTGEKPITTLLLGDDSRQNESTNTDAIIYSIFKPSEGKILLVSIPRDTYVEMPGYAKKFGRINYAQDYGGMKMTLETVANLLQSPIDYYAKINFKGFEQIIDQIGGIPLNLTQDLVNKGAGHEKFTVKAGKSSYSGQEALNYVRFREDDAMDVGRAKRQQEVLKELLNQVQKPKNLIKIPGFLNILGENLKTDLKPDVITNMTKKIAFADTRQIKTETLKGSGRYNYGIDSQWYYVADPTDLARIRQEIQTWLNEY
jgi:LCP family protein required for cell wall assembly